MDTNIISSVINKLDGLRPSKIYFNLQFIETQLKILNENKHKSGIYFIFNIINRKLYIGSAITNRINVRFRNHLIHGTGSKIILLAVRKYSLENFVFGILEYFPGFVKKENLDKNHLALLEKETFYIEKFSPEYNILLNATSSLGYKHTDENKSKMRENYSLERKLRIGQLNKNIEFSMDRRQLLSKIAKLRNANRELRLHLSKINVINLILYNKDNTIHSKYTSISQMSKKFNCCRKTIGKCIKNNKIFKNIGLILIER